MLSDAGIKIIAPVNDAIFIECDEAEAEATIKKAQELMGDASEAVLGAGYRCKTDADIIRHPGRYEDPRGVETWNRIMAILAELEADEQTKKYTEVEAC